MSVFVIAAFSFSGAQAKDKSTNPPKRVYDNIPASWDYYFIEPELIEKYTGEQKKKICFHEDFRSPSKFKSTPIRSSVGRRGQFRDFRLMLGGTDFIVVDKHALIVKTEHSGTHILNLRYCKRELHRAKYLKFFDEIEANPSDHCYSSVLKDGLSFFTRRYAGSAVCKIDSIHEWTGPFELDKLHLENNALPLKQD